MAKKKDVIEWRLGKRRTLPAQDIEVLHKDRNGKERWTQVGYVSGDPSGYNFVAVVDVGDGEVSFTQKQHHAGGMAKTAEAVMDRAARGETD